MCAPQSGVQLSPILSPDSTRFTLPPLSSISPFPALPAHLSQSHPASHSPSHSTRPISHGRSNSLPHLPLASVSSSRYSTYPGSMPGSPDPQVLAAMYETLANKWGATAQRIQCNNKRQREEELPAPEEVTPKKVVKVEEEEKEDKSLDERSVRRSGRVRRSPRSVQQLEDAQLLASIAQPSPIPSRSCKSSSSPIPTEPEPSSTGEVPAPTAARSAALLAVVKSFEAVLGCRAQSWRSLDWHRQNVEQEHAYWRSVQGGEGALAA